jgi:hypothetical protein
MFDSNPGSILVQRWSIESEAHCGLESPDTYCVLQINESDSKLPFGCDLGVYKHLLQRF